MKKLNTQKGFTLVELAIVMTIIGLLIGGILKGQELVMNAKVASTIAQLRAYEAAITTFRDKYDAIPGDMTSPNTRLPNCPAASCAAPVGTAGNSVVGNPAWASAAPAWTTQARTIPAAGPTVLGDETILFWTHLQLADMISGVTTAAVTGGAPGWNTTHPAAKIGGGFIVSNGNGTIPPNSTAAAGTGPSGLVLVLQPQPTTTLLAGYSAAAGQPLDPARAAQIDRKMDDGASTTGSVQGYGVAASCFGAGTGYQELVTSKDCGLFFRLQG